MVATDRQLGRFGRTAAILAAVLAFTEGTALTRDGSDDDLRSYFAAVGAMPVLSGEETLRLAALARAGDGAARQRLISSNLRLVLLAARGIRQGGLPFVDLLQAGNMGLICAVDHFDPARGCTFCTYALPIIRRFMVREVHRSRAVHVPPKAVAGKGTRAGPAVARALQPVLSLDAGEGCSIARIIADPNAGAPAEAEDDRQWLGQVLGELPAAERRVVRARFGLGGRQEKTCEQIGAAAGITRQRVHQIHASAIQRLRAKAGAA